LDIKFRRVLRAQRERTGAFLATNLNIFRPEYHIRLDEIITSNQGVIAINIRQQQSTPHFVAMPRIRSEADESAARIISCPASINSKTAFWSTDPPKPAIKQR
jgi:hypothetical protein